MGVVVRRYIDILIIIIASHCFALPQRGGQGRSLTSTVKHIGLIDRLNSRVKSWHTEINQRENSAPIKPRCTLNSLQFDCYFKSPLNPL